MELFLQNCGVESLEIVVERNAAAPPERRRVDRPYLLIGRNVRNDLAFDDAEVSQRHAYLQAVGGRVFCVDLASRTGVHWPTGPQASGWVEWDQPLRVGRNVLCVARPELSVAERAVILKTEAGDAPAPPEVVFEVAGAGLTPAHWRMKSSLVLVGGASACKVRLRHDRISRFHCSLVRGPLGVWVVDLLSRDGTWVNGESVPWARLTEGDRLQIGPFELRIWYKEPQRAAGVSRLMSPTSRPVPAARLAPAVRSDPPPETLDRSLLLPVMNEFNRMQGQMMDQFHQTLVMMAEMFTTLHREQAGLVREELAEMRRLTEELNALKAEQARQALDRLPAPAEGLERPAPAARPADSTRPVEAAERAPVESAAEPASARPAAPTEQPVPAAPDVHDWLSRRVAALQEERNGRWRKILHFITGGKNP